MQLHRFYHDAEPIVTRDSQRLVALGDGLPRPWRSHDTLACCEACHLSNDLKLFLSAEELFDEQHLERESPLNYLDLEDVAYVLKKKGDSTVHGETAIFLLAVLYIRGSSRSCSRRA